MTNASQPFWADVDRGAWADIDDDKPVHEMLSWDMPGRRLARARSDIRNPKSEIPT